jgi:hypothetical protein
MTLSKLNELDDKTLWELCQKEELDVLPGTSRLELINALTELYEEEEKEKEKLQSLIIQIERSKFGYVSQLPEVVAPKEPSGELPEFYEENYCDLLLRDPDWAFCFWEIKSNVWNQHTKRHGFKGFYLQLMENQTPEINGPMNATYRIMLDERYGSRYIQLPKQGYYYQVEIIASIGNERDVVLRSPIVFSPPVQETINEVLRNSDPAYQAILEASSFFETEPLKRLEKSSSNFEKNNPFRLSDWSDE